MRPAVFSANLLRQFLRRNRIATLPQLKELLGTEADITVFRKLKAPVFPTAVPSTRSMRLSLSINGENSFMCSSSGRNAAATCVDALISTLAQAG